METPFIKKIKLIMEEPEYEEIICWTKANTAIEIKDEKQFQEKILPFHFRHNKMASFIRQLNLYGFKKIRSATLQTFTHPAFEEGKGLESILSQRKKNGFGILGVLWEVEEAPRVEKQVSKPPEQVNQAQRKEEKSIESQKVQNTQLPLENTFVYPTQSFVWPFGMNSSSPLAHNFFLPCNYFGSWGF